MGSLAWEPIVTIHTTVTTIAHGAVGMGQVWYRATGVSGVTTAQVAYRAADHDPEVRRVRFVGAGATAELLGFRPGHVVASDADMAAIAEAFSGRHLTHGVKTVRSRLSRIAAAPVRDVVAARLAEIGLFGSEVFTSKESAGWWSSLNRAADRGRSVSMLTAQGAMRVARSHGADVEPAVLWSALGFAARAAASGDVDVASALSGFADVELDLAHDDRDLGQVVWERACELASVSEVVGNAGYELTLTMPKSFSLAALSGDPTRMDEWFEVMQAAATHALTRLMDEAGFCSTGHRGDGEDVTVMTADGWAGFIATEISSRAGDPHLHVHCTLPNVLVGRDGLVRTMADGGRELHLNAARFAAWGQAYAVREALARGLVSSAQFDAEIFQWEVGGFTPETISLFSKARRSVLEAIDDADDGQALTVRSASARDRAAKRRVTGAKSDDQPTWTQLHEACRAEAAREGIDLDAEREATPEPNWPQPSTWTDGQWAWAVENSVCSMSATATRAKVLAHVDVAAALHDPAERDRVADEVLARSFARSHPSHDRGMRSGGHQFASRPVLAMERQVMDAYTNGLGAGRRRVSDTWLTYSVNSFAARSGFALNHEQLDAVRAIATSTDTITLVSGVAGSGKTSVLRVLNDALTSGHRRMLVASTANVAASKAGDESGAPWVNLRQLTLWMQRPDVSPHLFDVVVIDEASLADVRSVATVAQYCSDHGRGLVLMGDHQQLRAVGAGEIYNVLCSEHPQSVIRLQENQRQRTESGRIVADALHARDLTRAWDLLHDEDRIIVVRGQQAKVAAVAYMVVEHMREYGTTQVTCDAVTNVEVDAINDRVHRQLIATGAIVPDTVREVRGRGQSLTVGIGTVLRVSDPTGPRTPASERLLRSQRATVTTTAGSRMQLQMDDGTTRSVTPAALLKHFTYGYAGTVHKVQGQTSAVHVSAMSPVKDAASMYVSASRAREGVYFVADATEFLSPDELMYTRKWSGPEFDDAVIDRIEHTLLGRVESVDSAAASMRPREARPSYSTSGYDVGHATDTGMGMSW